MAALSVRGVSVSYDGDPCRGRRRPRRRRGARPRRPRPVRVRQVDPAAGDRGARAGVGSGALARPRRLLDPHPSPRIRTDVPGRPALPPAHRRPQRRLPASHPSYAALRDVRAGRRAARAGRTLGLRRPAADDPVRGRATAGRPRARPRRGPSPAAPRRAVERARCGPAHPAGRGPAPDPGRLRYHRGDGDPRPRGGLRGRRRPRRHASRAHRAGGPDRRRVACPG